MNKKTFNFIEGDDGKSIFDEVKKTIKTSAWYDSDSRTMIGSNTLLAAGVDSIVRNLGRGIRVANLRDLSNPEVMKMIEGRYITDSPAIVFRSMEDNFQINTSIIKKLAQMAEDKMGRLKLPILVTGFNLSSSGEGDSYRLDISPREDFSCLYDERLLDEHGGKRFSEVDEMGLPIFDKKGSRIWYTQGKGISGLWMNGTLGIYSGGGVNSLNFPSDIGRIILVREVN